MRRLVPGEAVVPAGSTSGGKRLVKSHCLRSHVGCYSSSNQIFRQQPLIAVPVAFSPVTPSAFCLTSVPLEAREEP